MTSTLTLCYVLNKQAWSLSGSADLSRKKPILQQIYGLSAEQRLPGS